MSGHKQSHLVGIAQRVAGGQAKNDTGRRVRRRARSAISEGVAALSASSAWLRTGTAMGWDSIGTVALGSNLALPRLGFGGAWLTGPGTYGPPPSSRPHVAPSAARSTVASVS